MGGGRDGVGRPGRLPARGPFGSGGQPPTLLRLVRAQPDPEPGSVRVLGVDDFAWRKGHDYGTVLVDLEAHRVIDVLADRSVDTLAAWLGTHPGVEIVCRDRAGCYADGAARGAPTAIHIADRFHLWHNLCQAVDRAVARLRPQWRSPSPEAAPPAEPAAATPLTTSEGALAARTRARHAEVHALLGTGLPHAQIAERLRLDRKTVRRFARATTPDELINGVSAGRRSSLDRHAAYLTGRWNAGVTSTSQLHQELHERGVVVSERTVRRFLIHLRQARATPDVQRPADPTRREVNRSITSHPDNVDDTDKTQLTELCDRCPDLDTARELVASFADMLVHRRGGAALQAWVQRAEASALPELRGYATGLRADWDAVAAGVTHAWSSGQVEGHVNRIKMIKRQMYGRANPDLLRTRVLAKQ
ncbi:ISL3 family transposase [Parafrankia sp. FMc6]|uniref:ISL3 family transposase n=1 Tax=Parafrankia soli TaxID=2599596 RepID=UPI0034D49EC6